MPKAAQKTSGLNIDLLPKDTIDVSSNKFLHWVLTLGRYFIIFTEIAAVSTFLFSIYLSKEKNDLRSAIRGEEIALDNIRDCPVEDLTAFCEERFLEVQNQITQVSAIRSTNAQTNKVIDEFLTLLPQGIKIDKLALDGALLTFSGTFLAEQQLQTLVESFNSSTKITGLDINNLSKEIDYTFTATATVNSGAFLEEAEEN